MNEKLAFKLENFERAVASLQELLYFERSNLIFRDALFLRFNYCYELGWKLLRSYVKIRYEEPEVPGPLEARTKAFEYGVIEDPILWREMSRIRNIVSHTYSELQFDQVAQDIISKCYPEFQRLINFVKDAENQRNT